LTFEADADTSSGLEVGETANDLLKLEAILLIKLVGRGGAGGGEGVRFVFDFIPDWGSTETGGFTIS
jgi:hypothetical protein